ncbi:MAG: formylglycine-generating enzyme family protein [Waterburya sp.]
MSVEKIFISFLNLNPILLDKSMSDIENNFNNRDQEEIEQLVDRLKNASPEEHIAILRELMTEEEKTFADDYTKSVMDYMNNTFFPMQKFVYPSLEKKMKVFSKKAIQIKLFEFETVKLEGENFQKIRQQAQYFVEELGNEVTLEMVSIPEGSFLMGSPKDEKDNVYIFRESPQHLVNISALYMGKFEITQAQWEAVMKENLSFNHEEKNHPVNNVSWLDATEFCRRLSLQTGRKYRLPSEAEWEYACRAGTTTAYAFGMEINPNLANYWDMEPSNDYLDTKPVGSYYANAFGLYDMHGNVYELCQDAWHENYEGSPTDGSAWENGKEKDLVVIRGGSFDYYEDNCRCAYRAETKVNYRYHGTGFRVVCS